MAAREPKKKKKGKTIQSQRFAWQPEPLFRCLSLMSESFLLAAAQYTPQKNCGTSLLLDALLSADIISKRTTHSIRALPQPYLPVSGQR